MRFVFGSHIPPVAPPVLAYWSIECEKVRWIDVFELLVATGLVLMMLAWLVLGFGTIYGIGLTVAG